MPQPAQEGQMSEGMKQLQMLKAARDKAIEEKNMEMIGKIETVIKDMYDQLDERGREVISELFPDLDFMMDSEEEAREAGMMEEEGEEEEAEEYGKGGYFNMSLGGTIDPTKLTPEQKRSALRQLNMELNAAKSSRYASISDQEKDIASIQARIKQLTAAAAPKS